MAAPQVNNVTILGAGQMGLVLADALVHRGVSVTLWSPHEATIHQLAQTRQAPNRLPSFVLPDSMQVTGSDSLAVGQAEILVNAVPTQFIREVWQRLAAHLEPDVKVVCVSKGIENETLLRPTDIIEHVLEADLPGSRVAVCPLSGPTIGAELANRLPATMVAASKDGDLARQVQDMFDVPWLRIYRSDDPIGVEIAGATKNVIAIAAGMTDGLKIGFNAKSALLSRGLAEIARLGTTLGARLETFFGIAGVGDLATTCFSPFGRNRTCGERLGNGESLADIESSTASVIEGVATTRSVVQLAKSINVEMPITNAVHAILFDGLAARDAINSLMSRRQIAERIG